ncbi:uncharacterized protein LOC126893596 isoform X2 [Daktulosphaira vitifoliae]|uniref:uncharacterized protein LOC126893596 isoform X2 n=1 Tax=Daktulosphaira vitifoliae TaxID=58002 RepID=UPI0021A9F231|nr:uncharacterized protein LOC126893596 isoform X2 [Daktulosphaira vitifoliae]
MIFHQFCALIIFFGVFVNIQFITCCCYKPTPENFEDAEELEIAWKLDTGYERLTQNLPTRVGIKEFKRIMTKDENKPTTFTLHNRPQIIYYNLYCSNLRDLLQYMSLIGSLERIQILKENNSVLLDESIIKHMLSLMLKTDLDAPLDPLWAMFMYAIYIRDRRYYLEGDLVIHFKDLIRVIIEILKSHAKKNCDINITNEIKINANDTYKNEEIKKVVNVMNKRNHNNYFFLSDIEVENHISLSKIYFNKVIQNNDILKTIILDYGEQSQKVYNVIMEDINTAYRDARNYHWFDLWIIKLGDYQDKVFGIFRIVALYFIRKHLSYLMFNTDNDIIKNNNSKMHQLLLNNHTLNNIFKFEDKQQSIDNIIRTFSHKPSNSRSYDVINSGNINLINEHIKRNYFGEKFNMFKEDDEIKKSLEDKLKNNFDKFKNYLDYLNNIYMNIDIKIVRSFIEYSSIYIFVEPPRDRKKETTYINY